MNKLNLDKIERDLTDMGYEVSSYSDDGDEIFIIRLVGGTGGVRTEAGIRISAFELNLMTTDPIVNIVGRINKLVKMHM